MAETAANGRYVDLADVGLLLSYELFTEPFPPGTEPEDQKKSREISQWLRDAEAQIDKFCRVKFKAEMLSYTTEIREFAEFLWLPRCVSVASVAEIDRSGDETVIDGSPGLSQTFLSKRGFGEEGFQLFCKNGSVFEPGVYKITGEFGYKEVPEDIPPIVVRKAAQLYRDSDFLTESVPIMEGGAMAVHKRSWPYGDYLTLRRYRSANQRWAL